MNIERIPEYLLRWGVTLFGILLSIFLVQQVGYGNYGRVALIFIGMGLFGAILIFREKVWMILPVAWALNGQVPELGVPMMLRDMIVMAVFGAFLAFKAFKISNRLTSWNWGFILGILMALYIGIGWIRNPVGVAALNSDRVGGRPYFNVFIGLLACWVLSQASLKSMYANRVAIAAAFARMLEGFLALAMSWAPLLIPFFERYYTCPYFSWALKPEDDMTLPGEEGLRRYGYLAPIGVWMCLYLVSAHRPLALLSIVRFWRPLLLAAGIVCIFLSGFRSALAYVIGAALLSGFLRCGWIEVWKMAFLGVLSLAFLIMGNGIFFQLPYQANRALSFLPGNWDPAAARDAQMSTKWRTEMWQEMLTTNRYIENHVLGDGFGFRKRDLELMAHYAKYGTQEETQINYMISGNVHSGPVSAIRYAGYAGLGLFLILLTANAVRAWRLMRRAQNGPFQLLAFVICIPNVLEPIFFVFIYGAFENSVPEALFAIGMLQLLENSLQDHEAAEHSKATATEGDFAPLPELVGARG
jgi:hypothetical protein